MKFKQSKLILFLIICIFTLQINVLAKDITIDSNLRIIYPSIISNKSSVSDFVYYDNNSKLDYNILTYPTGNQNGTVEVSGNDSSVTSLTIPNTVKDNSSRVYDVTTIAAKGFYGYKKLVNVVIPENVKYIKRSAFENCINLDNIRILSKDVDLYTDAFYNIDPNATFYVMNQRVEDEIIDYVDDYKDIVKINGGTDEGEYKVTLKAEKGGKVSGGGYYDYKDTVTIRATPDDDYEFDKWVVDDGDVDLDDKYDYKTTFKMPDERVTITAQFSYKRNNNKNSGSSSSNKNDNLSTNTVVDNNLQSIPLDDFFNSDTTLESLVVNLNNTTKAQTSKFGDVRGMNKNVMFKLNGYSWIINGKNIATNIMDKSYCDLGVKFDYNINSDISGLADNTAIGMFDLNYEETLPFEGALQFYPQAVTKNQPIYMYTYNENKLTYADFGIVKEDGSLQVNVKTNLPHILTTSIIKDTYVSQKVKAQNSDLTSIVPYYIEANNQRIVKLSTQDESSIKFVAPTTSIYYFKDNSKGFKDIDNHWAKSSINFVSSHEIFSGVSKAEFAPNNNITRGMFITALGNLDEVDTTWYYTENNTIYYAPYVEWASENNILNDLNNLNFDMPITREEMSLIFKNYADYLEIQLPEGNTTTFDDNDRISSWAIEAVSSMQKAGIINGKSSNNFNPQDLATRAEASVMFKRFLETLLNNI